MAKHQQPKADTKGHIKDAFSTSALFKKIGIESQRMEKINQKKFAKEKANKLAKERAGKMAQGHKQRKVQQPEHLLAAVFSNTIDVSRKHIQSKVNADIDAASLDLKERLTISDQHFRQLEQDAINDNEAMVQPFRDEELEWISSDGNRTGKTVLGLRMKKFQKTIGTQEQELARQLDEWTKCQVELHDMVLEYFGPEGLKQIETGLFEVGIVLSQELKKFEEEIEAERKKFAAMIKESANTSVKQMKESEKKLHLKQKKIEQDFMAMLADEEY